MLWSLYEAFQKWIAKRKRSNKKLILFFLTHTIFIKYIQIILINRVLKLTKKFLLFQRCAFNRTRCQSRTISAFTKHSNSRYYSRTSSAPLMDIYRGSNRSLVILIIAWRHQAETSKWSVELIFPCTTIAKSNLTMDVLRYNSANDRHVRSFQKLRSPIRSKG